MTHGAIYFDSSALVKLVVPGEHGANVAAAMYEHEAARFTCSLSFPETHSALVRRHRNAELSQIQFSSVQRNQILQR
jgi:predicted nucleic acid-binding protein